MSTELSDQLRAQAKEIAGAGHDGWGNTMTHAADALDEVVAALEAIRSAAKPIIRDPENTNTFASWATQVANKALAAVRTDSGGMKPNDQDGQT